VSTFPPPKAGESEPPVRFVPTGLSPMSFRFGALFPALLIALTGWKPLGGGTG